MLRSLSPGGEVTGKGCCEGCASGIFKPAARPRPVCWSDCKLARHIMWDVAWLVTDWRLGCLWGWLLCAGPACGHVLQVAVLEAGALQIAAHWSSCTYCALVPLDSKHLVLSICVVGLAKCFSVSSQVVGRPGLPAALSRDSPDQQFHPDAQAACQTLA